MKKVIKRIVLLLVLAISANAQTGVIDKIIDGDTIKFKNGTSCRFAYIDTPESNINQRLLEKIHYCRNKIDVDDFKMVESGLLAKEYLKSKISINDEIIYNVIGKDRHKREICEISFNNININLEMVKNGFAFPYYKYIKDKKTKEIYYNANKYAMLNKKGLYEKNNSTMECLKLSND